MFPFSLRAGTTMVSEGLPRSGTIGRSTTTATSPVHRSSGIAAAMELMIDPMPSSRNGK
jgi:hypothetical protein